MKNIFFPLALLAGSLAIPARATAQTPTGKQFASIEKIMAPQRKKVTDILDADKTGQYKIYRADLKAMAKEKDPSRQRELAEKLERDHLDFIRKAYAGAKINNTELRNQVAGILGHSEFSFDEFANIQIDVIAPDLALPLRFDATLLCPFDQQNESDNNLVAAQCDAEAFDCSMAVESLAEIAGGCRSKADVGARFELPEGAFTNITAVVQSDISYRGFAVAVAGYGQINAGFGVRFQAPGIDKTVLAKEVHAVAPIVWYRQIRGEVENFTAQASFPGSFSGGTAIKVQAHTEVFALSVPALSLTEMDAGMRNIDSIRITGSN